MRLDKYLSNATDYSRKEIKQLIKRHEVTVNGREVTDPGLHVSEDDDIELQDFSIAAPRTRYIMLHKPVGYVSATDDTRHPTALSLLDEARLGELHIAGRLDIDTTGLLLITDDGQWSHRIISPKHKLAKRYYVTTAEPIEESYIEAFEKGLMLNGEHKRTKPAELEILDSHTAYLSLTEGRYHQVKRMFAAMGNHVVALHRDRVGAIELDPELEPGEYRELTEQEVASIHD